MRAEQRRAFLASAVMCSGLRFVAFASSLMSVGPTWRAEHLTLLPERFNDLQWRLQNLSPYLKHFLM
jgi:hypothetical protein